ncbi:MAG: MerR family transcriptional regulator [Chloroflexi bacterium]|nr:MerR family transcriptional regulator [Chloroflexota bacterium]
MFTVGDFARFAQVSKRLLRYYDEIDLFKPEYVDETSGYRFYSPEQMVSLNRILALKELGLSLDQIRQTLSDNISTDELQGMLLLRKAEIEQQLQAELQRVRIIERHLQAIRDDESTPLLNVILKEIPDQPVTSVRYVVDDFEMAVDIVAQLHAVVPERVRNGFSYCICHGDHHAETNLDMEFGVSLAKPLKKALSLPNGLALIQHELAGSNLMATTIVQGGLQIIHAGYAAILKWLGAHSYRLAGTPRELVLQQAQTSSGGGLVTEIQFPVEPIPNLNAIRY